MRRRDGGFAAQASFVLNDDSMGIVQVGACEAAAATRTRGSRSDSRPVTTQKPTLKKRMRSTEVTKSRASASFAAAVIADLTGFAEALLVVDGQPGIGCVGSLALACS